MLLLVVLSVRRRRDQRFDADNMPHQDLDTPPAFQPACDEHSLAVQACRGFPEWIFAGLSYWCKLQERNGSFNQWFPYEYSIAATAFTLGPMIEICESLEEEIPTVLKNKLQQTLSRAGAFLMTAEETHGFISRPGICECFS